MIAAYGGDAGNLASATSCADQVVEVVIPNHAPAGTDKTVTINEDTTKTFAASDFGFTDPNDSPANSLAAVKITTLPSDGTLKLDGAAVNAGDFVSATDLAANKLTYDPAANANGSGYASFTFQVQDDGGTANGGVDTDPDPNTITIDVTSRQRRPDQHLAVPTARSPRTPPRAPTSATSAPPIPMFRPDLYLHPGHRHRRHRQQRLSDQRLHA